MPGCDSAKAPAVAKEKTDAHACCPAPSGGHAAVIDTAALAKLIQDKSAVVIVDARSATYDDGRRIPGAKLVAADTDDGGIAKALPDKAAAIIVYCTGTKCPASAKLAARLKALGYSNVSKYPDGIEGWVAAGHQIEQVAPAK